MKGGQVDVSGHFHQYNLLGNVVVSDGFRIFLVVGLEDHDDVLLLDLVKLRGLAVKDHLLAILDGKDHDTILEELSDNTSKD